MTDQNEKQAMHIKLHKLQLQAGVGEAQPFVPSRRSLPLAGADSGKLASTAAKPFRKTGTELTAKGATRCTATRRVTSNAALEAAPPTPDSREASSAAAQPTPQAAAASCVRTCRPADRPAASRPISRGEGSARTGIVSMGITIDRLEQQAATAQAASQANAREEQLQSENAALKGEVAYLNKLLAIACSEPSSTSCSLAHRAGSGEVGGASLLERAPAVPPSQAGAAAGLSAERLRMMQMRNAQLDRQIVLAQGQIQATQEVVAEATSVLDQTVQQLGPLMAQLSTGQALEAALLQATLRWARQARQRLNSLRHSANLRAATASVYSTAAGSEHASFSTSMHEQAGWQVPLRQRGQNGFLRHGSHLTVAGLCTGDGAALVDPARVHQLEGQLGQLAPVLAALAVTMRASMLPSLALLNQRAAAAVEIQIAGAAERVAQAAQGLSSLASVLPASGQLLPPTVVEADRQEEIVRQAQGAAGQWGACSSADGDPEVDAVSIGALPSWQSVLSGLAPAVTRDGVLRQRLKSLLQRWQAEQKLLLLKIGALSQHLRQCSVWQREQASLLAHVVATCSGAATGFSCSSSQPIEHGRQALLRLLAAQDHAEVSPSQASVKGLLAACQQAAPALTGLADELATSQAATQQQVTCKLQALEARVRDAIRSWHQQNNSNSDSCPEALQMQACSVTTV